MLGRHVSRIFALPSHIQKRSFITSQPFIMKIRKHKMRKMKWRKRVDKFWFQTRKLHTAKKLEAEALFRARMQELLVELENFEPMKYVKEIITKAKKEWYLDAAPTGRKKHPHWSTLMSLEELFGIEKNDHIDKRYGLPNLEERPLLGKLQDEYKKNYVMENPSKLLNNLTKQNRIIGQIGKKNE